MLSSRPGQVRCVCFVRLGGNIVLFAHLSVFVDSGSNEAWTSSFLVFMLLICLFICLFICLPVLANSNILLSSIPHRCKYEINTRARDFLVEPSLCCLIIIIICLVHMENAFSLLNT